MNTRKLPLLPLLAAGLAAVCLAEAVPAAGQERSGEARAAVTGGVTDVWVVFKTHFDIGYTDLITNVLARYRGPMIDQALAVMEANRTAGAQRFSWTVPGWPLSHILGPQQTPERRARIEAALKEGSLAVHAAPFTLHTESLDLEDLVRSLHYSAQISRDYGLPLPRSAKMTDVPEHSWILPTLFAHAGIRFLHIGCNSACQYPRFPRLFWWEGPDGSRILCNYTADYGSGLTPPPDWPAQNYLAMVMTGDNHGPPSAAEVESLRKQAATQLPAVKIHVGTLDDFLAAIEAEQPSLPVVRCDTPDTWIHGLQSMPQTSGLARQVRPLLPVLDSLDTHLRAFGLSPAPLASALAQAYEGSLLYGEHTWGMNAAFGGREIWPLAEWKQKLPVEKQQRFLQSFEDHRDHIRRTAAILTRELQARLELLAASVHQAGRRVVVWNGLPWTRSGIAEVEGSLLYADDIPPNGYKTFRLPAPGKTEIVHTTTLETPFYRVHFDLERGGIASLVEKSTRRELVDKSSPYALGQFLHERFSQTEVDRFFQSYSRMKGGWASNDLAKPGLPPTQYLAISPADWTISIDRGPVADRATLRARDTKGLARDYSLTFTFPRKAPYVDLEWAVKDKTPDKTPEGGWLCFPFAMDEPGFTVGRLGGPIDPARDILPGANRHLYAVETGVLIRGAKGGSVGLCPVGSPLVSLGKPGLWWWSLDYVPTTPAVFVNLYNNKWNTNFPLWQDGSWSTKTRFWPGGNLASASWEARVPLLAMVADGPAGRLPKQQAGLGISRPAVLVTAFGENPDGPGTLLRLWDQSGITGEAVVRLPGVFKSATPVNLRGEKAGPPIGIRNRKLVLSSEHELRSLAPASFVLE